MKNFSGHGAMVRPNLVPLEQEGEISRKMLFAPQWDLLPRQLAMTELLTEGALSPLRGFMTEKEAGRVIVEKKLPSGLFWPLPLILDVPEAFAEKAQEGWVGLRDPEGLLVAAMQVHEVWPLKETMVVSEGTGVFSQAPHPVALAGEVWGFGPAHHYDFSRYWKPLIELREDLEAQGKSTCLGFFPLGVPGKKVLQELLDAARALQASLLVLAPFGRAPLGVYRHFARTKALLSWLEHASCPARLRLLPVELASWQEDALGLAAVLAKNFGVTHLALPQGTSTESLRQAGIEPVFLEGKEASLAALEQGFTQEPQTLRENFFEEEFAELQKAFPPPRDQGFTVFFTGLSGSGKSTLAHAVTVRLMEMGKTRVTLLDGDIVRKNLSSELGFSREHRDLNIRRIGFVASEITKAGGVAICAPIAPYAATRQDVRQAISKTGGFFEVYVSTPLEVCEKRDRKGLYAKARQGLIKEFTGISDPYEVPENPEVVVDTSLASPEACVEKILSAIRAAGFL